MKRIFLFLSVVLPIVSFGGSDGTDETEMVKEIRSFYDKLDHSGMKTDYLFNRGFVILNNLEEWRLGKPLITNNYTWEYILKSIEKSNISDQKQLFDTELVNKIVSSPKNTTSSTDISVICIEGDYITNESVKNHLKNGSTLIYDLHTIFSGNIIQPKMFSGNVSFKWLPDYYFSNLDDIVSIDIDFSDSKGFIPIDVNKQCVVDVNYDFVGEKSICFRLIKGLDTLYSYSKVDIVSLEKINPTSTGKIYDGSIEEISNLKSAESDPNVSLSYGNYHYYEGIDGVLDKPIIIAEGFDIAGTMSRDDLYSKWQGRISSLVARGYDVFILNFTSPVRSLQVNANVVEDLIKGINQNKVGNFEGVYIGESMGGILGRIALKNMENQGYDHQIGLYIPYDSPFKGASISKGIQWVLRDMADSFGLSLLAGTFLVDLFEFITGVDVPIVDIYSQLNSTAAKQMLARHYSGSSEYNTFQNYLDGLGYPSLSRNVAVVNGSDLGYLQSEATPGAEIFSQTIILGALWDVSVKAWYDKENEVDQQVSRVFYFSLLTPLLTQFKRRYETFDNKPYTNGTGSYVWADYNSIKFTFVPTLSAIDISNSIYNTGNFSYYKYYNKNTVINNGESPFDDIYSYGGYNHSNKFHTTQYFDISDIELREFMHSKMYLQNRTLNHNRDFEAANTITVGNNTQPWGTAKHQATGDFVINSGKTVNMVAGQSVKLTAGFKLQSGATFKASVDPTDPTLKSGSVEKLAIPQIIGAKNAKPNDVYIIEKQFDYNEKISWVLLGNNYEHSSKTDKFYLPDNLKNGQYTLVCRVSTNGQEVASSKILVVNNPNTINYIQEELISRDNNFSIYPNPANSMVTIEIEESKLENSDLVVTNISGKTVLYKPNIQSNHIALDISTLQNGIYFIGLIRNRRIVDIQKLIKQ